MSAEDETRRLWQDQPVEPLDLSVEVVRRRAAGLDRTVRFRDLREHLAGAILAVVWLGAAFAPESPGFVRAYALVSLAGAVVVLRHLRRHGRSKPAEPAADAPTSEHVAFLRARLEAQRALLASAWRWYIGPLVPGVIVLVAGVAISAPPAARAKPLFWLVLGGIGALVALTFAGVGWLNAHAARKLEEEIRTLG